MHVATLPSSGDAWAGLCRMGPSCSVTHLPAVSPTFLPAHGRWVRRSARLALVAPLRCAVQPKGLLPRDGTGHLPHFQPGWPAGPGGASAVANDDILRPFDIAALALGERGGLSGSRCREWGGRECGAVRSHLSARSSPCKGHSPSLAFVADL